MAAVKKRLWRKLHLGIDEETLEIRAVDVTTSNIGDTPSRAETKMNCVKLLGQGIMARDFDRQVAEF